MDVFVAYALQSVAVIAALAVPSLGRPELDVCERSARLLGCVDAQLAALGSSRLMIHEQLYDRVMETLREALGFERLADLAEAGAQMSRDLAIAEALAI